MQVTNGGGGPQRGSSLLTVLITIGVALGAVQTMSTVQTRQAKSTTRLSYSVVAEHYNRLAVLKLKHLLDESVLDLTVDRQGLRRPELTVKVPTAVRQVQVWDVENPGADAVFISKSCPSGMSTHLGPETTLSFGGTVAADYDATWQWSDAACVGRGIAVTTEVRVVELAASRASVVVQAITEHLGESHALRAVVIVPQRLLCEAMQCNLSVSRANAVANQNVQITIEYAQHLTNEIRYRLRRVDLDPAGTLMSELTLAPVSGRSSMTRTVNFPNPGQYEIDIEVAGGGCPCNAQQTVNVSPPATPPPAEPECKWADPNYAEVVTWTACSMRPKFSPQAKEFQLRVGRRLGQEAGSKACSDFGFPLNGCRFFSSVHATRTLRHVNAQDCRNMRGGHIVSANGDKVIVGFSFPTSTNPRRKCGFTVVNVRNKHNGCLPPESQIRMGDGSLRPIGEISAGDLVWNPRVNASLPVRRVVAGPEEVPLVRLEVLARTFLVTETHPMLTRRGLVQAQHIRPGDELFVDEKSTTRVYRADRAPLDSEQMVFNIELDVPADFGEDGSYFEADGIVVGDYALQVQLEQATQPHQ